MDEIQYDDGPALIHVKECIPALSSTLMTLDSVFQSNSSQTNEHV